VVWQSPGAILQVPPGTQSRATLPGDVVTGSVVVWRLAGPTWWPCRRPAPGTILLTLGKSVESYRRPRL